MTEKIAVIEIIGGSGKALGGGSSAGSDSGAKGMGAILSTSLKAIGIGSLVGMVAVVASQFTGLISVVGGILKMIGNLLKPIADVVMVLLMPILYMLKPIIILVNQIFAPYIKAAMQAIRAGAQASSATGNPLYLLQGAMTAGNIFLVGLTDIFAQIALSVLGMIGDTVIDLQTQGLILLVNAVAGLLEGIFPWMTSSIENAKANVIGDITTASGALKAVWDTGIDTAKSAIHTSLVSLAQGMSDNFSKEMNDKVAVAGKDAIKAVTDGWTSQWNEWKNNNMKNTSSNSRTPQYFLAGTQTGDLLNGMYNNGGGSNTAPRGH